MAIAYSLRTYKLPGLKVIAPYEIHKVKHVPPDFKGKKETHQTPPILVGKTNVGYEGTK